MSRIILAHCLFAAILGGGCAAPEPPAGRAQPVKRQALPILRGKAGNHSGLQVPVRMVIRDRATLAQVPLPYLPIDFDKEMVLLAALGTVPTEGYAVRITGVWREQMKIRVSVQTTPPQPAKQHRKLNLCNPYHLVVVPRSNLNVEGFSTSLPTDPRGHNPYK
jgi:hypothetical protein